MDHHRHHHQLPPHKPPQYRHDGSFINSPHLHPSPNYIHPRFPDSFPPSTSRVSPIIHRQVQLHPIFHDYLSPTPPFVDHVDRFRGEFVVDNRFRLDCFDEVRRRDYDVFDERRKRSVDDFRRDVVYDDWRSMNDFEREELLRYRIDKRKRIRDNLEREEFLRRCVEDDERRIFNERFNPRDEFCDRVDERGIMNDRFSHRDLIPGCSDFGVSDELFCDRIDADERRIMSNGFNHRGWISGSNDLGVRDGFLHDRIDVDQRRIVNDGFNHRGLIYGSNDFGVRDELFCDRIDERRIVNDEFRGLIHGSNDLGVRDELFRDRIDERRIVNDGFDHGPYHREAVFRDDSDFIVGEGVDSTRRIRDENALMNFARHGAVCRSPVNYGGREIEVEERFPEFYEGRVNGGMYVDGGRIQKERAREDLRECYDRNPRKKISFHRLQPTGTFRKKLDNTNSTPHKGKEINGVILGHNRSSEKKFAVPVGSDVSFMSNGVVVKATPPSVKVDGVENVRASALDTRIVVESPLKARLSRNSGNNSPVSKKEEKQSENQVRLTPILMKVGIRKIAEVPDNTPKSSSSGSSSLARGDNTCMGSDEGEGVSKDDKRANNRRKRKAVNLISRLSTSVPTNFDTVVDVDNSISCPSSGSMSNTPGSLGLECAQDEPHVSISNAYVTRSIEKHSSDIDAKTDGVLEKISEPLVVSVVDSEGKIDVFCGHMNLQDSVAGTNFITCDFDASIMTENKAYSASSDVNATHGFLPKCDIIGQLSRDLDNEAELSLSGDEMKLVCSPSVGSKSDILSTDCGKIAAVSDIEVINDIQEQQCTGASSILANDKARKRRKVSLGGNPDHLALSSVKEDAFSLDRKRNGGINVCDVDPKYRPYNCNKKRKSITHDSVTESCDLCSSGLESPNAFLPPEDVVGEVTNSLMTVISALGDSSKTEIQLKDSPSTMEEIAQSSYMLESGCNRKDEHLIGARNFLGNEVNRSDSEVEMAEIYQNGIEDLNDGDRITDLECKSIITVKGNLSTLSDCPCLCTDPTQEIMASKPVGLDKASKLNSLGVLSKVTSTCDISSPAIHTTSDYKIYRDDKKSESLRSLVALSSKSNLVRGEIQKNVKPVNLTASRHQPFIQKATTVPSKYAKKEVSIPSSVSRQFSWRNNSAHGKTTTFSSQASPVCMFPKKILSTIPAKPRTWHRTDNLAASNTIVKKPLSSMAPSQRPPYGKSLKVQDTSYIRKGNSLVRKFASSTTASASRAFNASIVQEKPIDIDRRGKLKSSGTTNSTELPDCLITGRRTPTEMPKVHQSQPSEKASDCNIAYMGDCTSPLQVERFGGMDTRVALEATETAFSPFRSPENILDRSFEGPGNLSDRVLQASNVNKLVYIKRKANKLIAASTPPELSPFGNPEFVLDQSFEDAGNLSDGVAQALNVNKVVYIKRKANQLIAAPTPPEPTGSNNGKNSGLSSDSSYYKRRKNQLIRASSESNIQKMVSAADDSSNIKRKRAFNVYFGRSSSKGLSRRVKPLKVALVWKLGDVKSSDKSSEPLRSKQLLSHLLPWKRTTFRKSVWRASASFSNCPSLIKPRKLLSSRDQALVYERSGRGFSLKRSKVISLGGSLKWSKSMEKRSKKVDEEAALAVAVSNSTTRQKTGAPGLSSETGISKLSTFKSVHGLKYHPGERIFRVGMFRYRMDPSRRTLQRIPDEEAPDSTTSTMENYARKSYMPKRLLIGSNEYVRIGNGNQLVRDPKRRTRILASEKVRWSLHTARLRLAKKRKFCQFFTRFGRCNKSEGKCPYIHDSSKISVCTKFLKGLCTDPNCILTHKVIPDRMPDCSFFLQGLCSNESCPYRHVNVNPKASICEGFLRGYCAEGRECQKKHSYLCPEFEATGICPQGSNCKLYHPKKGVSKKGKITEDQRNIRGRYFDPGLTAAVSEPNSKMDHVPKNSDVVSEGVDLGDYISLDLSDDEAGESIYPNNEVKVLSEFVAPKNSPVLSGGDLGDYMILDHESVENNQYPNREVKYLSEFDVLNYLSDDVKELAKPVYILDTP